MRLDRVIQILLPHDEKFYAFFEDQAKILVQAAELLPQLLNGARADQEAVVNRLHDLEHQGDTIAHKIFAELNATFVTPFDREDIHTLASALDDVMDNIDGSAARFVLYKIDQCPEQMLQLMQILARSVIELQQGVGLLRDFRKAEELQKVLEKVNEYENQADAIFESAIAQLFEYEKNPINIIKLKEVFVGLETATDKCEDAANVMESLLIKHG